MRPILLVIICFASVGHIRAQQPVTPKTVAKLTRDVNQLKHQSARVYNDFEAAKPHKGPFGKVVSDIKQHKHRLRQLSGQITLALTTSSLYSFIERMILEFNRIQLEKLGEIFDWIVLEIVGRQVGIQADFTPMHFSETIEIANNVAHYKFVQLVSQANETNRLIVTALAQANKREANATAKVSREVRCKIDRQLDALARVATEARTELSKEYLEEVAKFIEQKKEMNLVQKMQVEKFIDTLQFVVQFVRTFQRQLRQLLPC